jgi:hypothetical protein
MLPAQLSSVLHCPLCTPSFYPSFVKNAKHGAPTCSGAFGDVESLGHPPIQRPWVGETSPLRSLALLPNGTGTVFVATAKEAMLHHALAEQKKDDRQKDYKQELSKSERGWLSPGGWLRIHFLCSLRLPSKQHELIDPIVHLKGEMRARIFAPIPARQKPGLSGPPVTRLEK